MGVMVMFNFKLNQKEKKSMFILGLISFAVWFVNPFYGEIYRLMIFNLDKSKQLWGDIIFLSLPLSGTFLNMGIYYLYLKCNKNIIIILILLVLIVLLCIFYFLFITIFITIN